MQREPCKTGCQLAMDSTALMRYSGRTALRPGDHQSMVLSLDHSLRRLKCSESKDFPGAGKLQRKGGATFTLYLHEQHALPIFDSGSQPIYRNKKTSNQKHEPIEKRS